MQKIKDLLLILIVNFIWATQVPVIRIIGDKLGPVTIAFIPLLISTLLFLPFLLIERKKTGAKPIVFSDLKHFILPGLIGIFLMQYLYTLGSSKTLAANAGIITLCIPILVAIIASVFLKEKLNIVRILSFIIAIVGVLMLSVPDLKNADFSENRFFAGNMIFLLACVCCAVYNTYCKVLVSKGYTELEILVYSSITGSIACIPFLVWAEPFSFSSFLKSDTITILCILELSFFVYGLSMILFFSVLKRMDITQAILGNYLLPFFIALLGLFLLGESITIYMIIGGLTILIATLVLTVFENRLIARSKQPK